MTEPKARVGGPIANDFDKSKPGWYLNLIQMGNKPKPYAWLDPTRLYIFQEV